MDEKDGLQDNVTVHRPKKEGNAGQITAEKDKEVTREPRSRS